MMVPIIATSLGWLFTATLDKYQKGELLPLLNDAGAIANNSAQQ